MIVRNWHKSGRSRSALEKDCMLACGPKTRGFDVTAIRDSDRRILNMTLNTAECKLLHQSLKRYLIANGLLDDS